MVVRFAGLVRLLYLVQGRHGPFWRLEALVLGFVSATLQHIFVLFHGHAVRVMETFVNGGIERSAKEIASTMYACSSAL